MSAPVQSPAADYRCTAKIPGCRFCRPDAQPCTYFWGGPDLGPGGYDQWCPACGWAEWAHRPVVGAPAAPS